VCPPGGRGPFVLLEISGNYIITCPYRCHVLAVAAAAVPTRPLDPMSLACMCLRHRKLRSMGQRRVMRLEKPRNALVKGMITGNEMTERRKPKSKGIVTWPEGERPRERLLRQGAQSLTDAELVAILLRVGVQGTSAVELARQILKKFGSLRALAEAPLSALLVVRGLKGAKTAQLAATMEVARRIALPDRRDRVTLKTTSERWRSKPC